MIITASIFFLEFVFLALPATSLIATSGIFCDLIFSIVPLIGAVLTIVDSGLLISFFGNVLLLCFFSIDVLFTDLEVLSGFSGLAESLIKQ